MAEGSGAQGQARLRPDLRLDFSVANASQPASLLLKESELRGHGHSERPGTHAEAPPRCLGGLSRGRRPPVYGTRALTDECRFHPGRDILTENQAPT